MFSRSSSSLPTFKNYHCVGFVKSAHGLRGEIYVQLAARQADWLSSLNSLYLLTAPETTLREWPVEFCRPHKDGLIVKMRGCDDRNQSENLRKSSVYILESLLEAAPGEGLYLHQVLHFTLIDVEGRPLGQIVGFATNGVQDLLRVKHSQGEALIPFVEAFLKHIDFDKKQVKMDLPPGLMSLEDG